MKKDSSPKLPDFSASETDAWSALTHGTPGEMHGPM